MSGSMERMRAVLRLELLTQRREPLTVLYVLVLGLLAAAFAAAGPVELVRNRGAAPRDAAWSMLLASTALTAFGQVITTMVAATVVLRDEQDRVAAQLIVSRLTRREYLMGKFVASLVMLAVIYAAIPIGLAVGALLAGGAPGAAFQASLPPFVIVVLPTMLAIGALQFAIGVLSGRLWVIVAQGLMLIWLWSACVDAAMTSGGSMAALLDPFGSTAVLRATASWTDLERATRGMPMTPVLLGSRAIWMVLGGAAVALAMVRAPHRRTASVSRANPHEIIAVPLAAALRRGTHTTARRAMCATAAYVARWMLRDAGWRVIAMLGATNVSVHAFLDARRLATHADVTSAALSALQLHARLFLILLATIYAGELVWRERDDRSAPLFDVLPVRDLPLLAGRLLGTIAAQCVLVFGISSAPLLAAMAGARAAGDLRTFNVAILQTVLLPFIAWMLLSLAVHVVVQQKVAAHLICIAAWVLAVLMSRVAAAPTAGGDRLSGWWAAWVAAALLITWRGWARGPKRTLRA